MLFLFSFPTLLCVLLSHPLTQGQEGIISVIIFYRNIHNLPKISYRRCGGIATNFLVSISSHQDCLDACNRDDRCCHYSHHKGEASHPDHNTCYLFSSGDCDMEDLRLECVCNADTLGGGQGRGQQSRTNVITW